MKSAKEMFREIDYSCYLDKLGIVYFEVYNYPIIKSSVLFRFADKKVIVRGTRRYKELKKAIEKQKEELEWN